MRKFGVGIICSWRGSIATIPTGFALCDGTQGTPDLRNRFVVGAGSTYAPAATGGAVAHVHDFTGDDHAHPITPHTDVNSGAGFFRNTSFDPAIGTTDLGSTLAPYYALCYIMEL